MSMVATEIRRQNARALLVNECRGVAAEFGKRIERADTQVNHLIGPKPTKGIGPKLARLIEQAFGRPKGWLDVRHDSELLPEAEALARIYQELPEKRKETIRNLCESWGVPITGPADENEEEAEEEAEHT